MKIKAIIIFFLAIAIIGSIFVLVFRNAHQYDRIIFITIDTFRADHLGCYGYPRNITPFIDRLASKGVRFKEAFAPMPITAPSHTSMLTALYPIQHNVLVNGHVLEDRYITVAELLKKNNFKTAGIVSTEGQFKAGNIDQGFDYFNEPSWFRTDTYREADETIDEAIDWLGSMKKDDKFFLWIHLFDPHTPNRRSLKNSDVGPKEMALFLHNKHHIDFSYFNNDIKHILNIVNSYDGEIAFADKELNRFFDYYNDKGFNKNTAWIIAGDHGEGLGNHRWRSHGKYLYREQIHVPLILYFSDHKYEGVEIDDLVELIDITPTILDFAGVSNKELYKQAYEVHGQSLVPLFHRRMIGGFKKEPLFVQRRPYEIKNRPKKVLPDSTNYEDGETYAVHDDDYKYIYHTARKDEFFDVQKDPFELVNIIEQKPKKAELYKKRLLKEIQTYKEQIQDPPQTAGEAALEKLRSLGYLQ